MDLWNQRLVVRRRHSRLVAPLFETNFSIDTSCPIVIYYFTFEFRERSYLTCHKRIKVGFCIILCLPHSVMYLKRNTYATCNNLVLLRFYYIIFSENTHPIRVHQVLYILNIRIKMRSHH